ncbi:hypothetical protein MMC14_003100 [Varicellaria rhodocarpa]|nr:hypothetical protein [Varicellaria rhodocarpa]
MCRINELIWACGCVRARNTVYICPAVDDNQTCCVGRVMDAVPFNCETHRRQTNEEWDFEATMMEFETAWWENQLAEEEAARANAEVAASPPPSPYLAPLPAQVQAQEVKEGDEEVEVPQPPDEEAASPQEEEPSNQNGHFSRSSPRSIHTPEHQITGASSSSSNQESQQLLQELNDAAVLNARRTKRPSRGWAYIDEDVDIIGPTESEIFEQIVKQNSGGKRKRL